MRNDNRQNGIGEKLDTLSPLSGGVVFGKEEAWDKLQARLEAKPTRVIPFRYWMSAAALLLLFVCIFALMERKSPIEEQKTTTVTPAPQPANPSIVVPERTPVVSNISEERHTQKAVAPSVTAVHYRQKVATTIVDAIPVPELPQPGLPQSPEQSDEAPPVVKGKPTPVTKPMPVYYIGDVERGNADPVHGVAVSTPPSAAPVNNKVVFINDIERQDLELHTLHNESRITNFYPVLRISDRMAQPPAGDGNQQHIFIRSIFNP